MKKINIIAVVILLLSLFSVNAQEPEILFQEGVNAYSEQNYPLAERKFDAVLNSGFVSGELYFNMGNTAYKQRDYARAILYYEKARLLLPADDDLEANLTLANSHTVDKIETLPKLFYEKWWDSLIISMSADQWAFLNLILLALALVLFIVYRFSTSVFLKKAGFYSSLIALFFFLFTIFISAQSHKRITAHDHAIVFVPSVTAKSSPFSDSIDIFVIHEGLKVKIDNREGEWVRIRLANGNVGWVKSETLEII
ncbi:MAG: hypothetical protein C0593_00765 [Marinilabiliales bacterium]|nr:MAG: hypothetical protein C0593_00765 [Marinilabiliales bacterium]